ncbi:restriction endonuclease subunit S [Ramlibacter monticola]|uniref:Restriction endonuclease subunit S n=1 Tax=Ramlibacter monticola TaxID=1926872 RepID=A0A936YYD7_9BURK|nr:restriction endonuclease subunit S [Ramlibacter monticola]
MPADWRWRLLTDVARLETGHTPSRRHPEWWGGSVPWIGIRDATGNHGSTIHKTQQYTNELGIRNSSARVLPANTVCLSRTASVGYVVVMGVPMATSQDFVNWVCGVELDYRYLKYVLLAERRAFLRFASGTTHQTIYFPEVKAFHIATPPLKTQRGIAEFLGALDDRIDILRQTNATLESIAQALFKSWFIDFDPVRAKGEGREPEGMHAVTAALFPGEFDESALGMIPKGWAVRSIDDVAQRVGMGPFGSNIKVSTFVDSGVPVLTGACLRSTLLEDDEFRFITREHADRLSGSLVGEGDIVITHRGTLGQVSLIPAASTYETYVLSQSQFFVRANPHATTPEFLTYFLRCPSGQHLLLANASQVGVPSISRPVSYLRSLQIVVPPVAVANAFSSVATALHERIVAGRRQSGMLTELRDSLLPRLISGKLRLPEAQAQLEEVIA